MDTELKAKWIAALRSGKYQQGRGSLKFTVDVTDHFCCMGVLADLINSGSWSKSEYDARAWYWKFAPDEAYTECVLPDSTLDHVGLSLSDQDTLTSMNDGTHAIPARSFEVIADWIDTNL